MEAPLHGSALTEAPLPSRATCMRTRPLGYQCVCVCAHVCVYVCVCVYVPHDGVFALMLRRLSWLHPCMHVCLCVTQEHAFKTVPLEVKKGVKHHEGE